MTALQRVITWPVDHVAAAVVTPDGVDALGDTHRIYRYASLSKPISTWAIMVGVEEGIVDLDAPLADPDLGGAVTLRHLLSHAAGFGFDSESPIAPPERRRTYSNSGFDRAAAVLARAAEMDFGDYLREAVFAPLGMHTAELHGSPAHAVHGSLDDVVAFVAEMLRPRLLAPSTHAEVITVQYPELAGIIPGLGRYDPCVWGLGVELRGQKAPHWTGRANSPATFGHFGGAGTMMWVDPLARVGLVALTDRPYDEWPDEALRLWPELSDAVLAEARG